MRLASLALLFGIAAASDPCQQLCRRDGPAVCTGGSWVKNGACHGYTLLQGGSGYCYHTSTTAHICPSSPALRVADAERLLGVAIARATSTVSPTTAPNREALTSTVRAAPPARAEAPRTTTVTPVIQEDVSGEDLERRQRSIMNRLNPNYHERRRLTINRETAFFSSLVALTGPAEDLRCDRYSITYTGESGYGDGVKRDWFGEVSRQISDPANGLLEPIPDAPSFVRINPRGKREVDYQDLYQAIGRFIGYSFASLTPMNIPFPNSFYARLLGTPVILEDIREEDPQMYRSLQYALEASRDELTGLELTIGGREFQLTLENRVELVNRKLNEPQPGHDLFEIIRAAFAQVIPIDRLVQSFSAAQLKRVLFGADEIDVSKIVMQYERHAEGIVRKLRSVLNSFTQAQRRLFVKFVTGSSQVPVGGFAADPIEVRLVSYAGDAAFPRAATCFHTLKIPNYSTEAVLKQRLIYAMENSQGMED